MAGSEVKKVKDMRQITIQGVRALPTVTIVSENGPVVINKDDFNAATMKLAEAEKATEAPATKEPEKAPEVVEGGGAADPTPVVESFNMEGVTIPVLRVVAEDLDLNLGGATKKDDILAVFEALEGDEREEALTAVKEEIGD